MNLTLQIDKVSLSIFIFYFREQLLKNLIIFKIEKFNFLKITFEILLVTVHVVSCKQFEVPFKFLPKPNQSKKLETLKKFQKQAKFQVCPNHNC